MIARTEGRDGIRYVALCDAGGEWCLIEENKPGKRDIVEAAKLCATHLHGTITRARNAAYKARDCYQEGRAETAATYLDLACEHLDVANTNAGRLLDEPGPDDLLDETIELAEPGEAASVRFVSRVIALSAECTHETGQPVEPWALLMVADAFTDMAQERITESADHVFVRLVSEAQPRAEVMTRQRLTSEGIDRAMALLRHMRSNFEPANGNGSEETTQPKEGEDSK